MAATAFDGDLAASEDSSALGRARYAEEAWAPRGRLVSRDSLAACWEATLAHFAALHHHHPPSHQLHKPPGSPSPPPVPMSLLSPFVLPDSGTGGYPAPPPIPVLAAPCRDIPARVRALQAYLRAFEYNHLGHEFHGVIKTRSFARTMVQAREMAREALPIKCLEAVVLATWATREWRDVERLPLRFKTRSGGHSYWHIVLALVSSSQGANGTTKYRFGSVGLSRRCTLDYRPMVYPSLSALVESFRLAYSEVSHAMHVITVGLLMARKEYAQERVCWHFLQLPVLQQSSGGRTAPKASGPIDAAAVDAEWVVVCEMLDRYWPLAGKLTELVRKQSLALSGGAATTTPASFTSALFIPPAALKTIGTVHAHVAYDSSLVALVYRPPWAHVGLKADLSRRVSGGASESGGSGSESDAHSASASDDTSSDSSSDVEVAAGHRSRPAADKPRRSHEEHKTVPPSFSLSAKSAISLRRAADRAERKRNRVLVEQLRDRHRIPLHAPATASASPPPAAVHNRLTPSASPPTMHGRLHPHPLRHAAASPTRSPGLHPVHLLNHLRHSGGAPPTLAHAAFRPPRTSGAHATEKAHVDAHGTTSASRNGIAARASVTAPAGVGINSFDSPTIAPLLSADDSSLLPPAALASFSLVSAGVDPLSSLPVPLRSISPVLDGVVAALAAAKAAVARPPHSRSRTRSRVSLLVTPAPTSTAPVEDELILELSSAALRLPSWERDLIAATPAEDDSITDESHLANC